MGGAGPRYRQQLACLRSGRLAISSRKLWVGRGPRGKTAVGELSGHSKQWVPHAAGSGGCGYVLRMCVSTAVLLISRGTCLTYEHVITEDGRRGAV